MVDAIPYFNLVNCFDLSIEMKTQYFTARVPILMVSATVEAEYARLLQPTVYHHGCRPS